MADRATYDSPTAQAFIERMLAALEAKPMTWLSALGMP